MDEHHEVCHSAGSDLTGATGTRKCPTAVGDQDSAFMSVMLCANNLTACQIRYHIHLWGQGSTGQL